MESESTLAVLELINRATRVLLIGDPAFTQAIIQRSLSVLLENRIDMCKSFMSKMNVNIAFMEEFGEDVICVLDDNREIIREIPLNKEAMNVQPEGASVTIRIKANSNIKPWLLVFTAIPHSCEPSAKAYYMNRADAVVIAFGKNEREVDYERLPFVPSLYVAECTGGKKKREFPKTGALLINPENCRGRNFHLFYDWLRNLD